MAQSKGTWKKERASYSTTKKPNYRSNKYSGGDSSKKPKPGTRQKAWVGGHKRNGKPVKGHFRKLK